MIQHNLCFTSTLQRSPKSFLKKGCHFENSTWTYPILEFLLHSDLFVAHILSNFVYPIGPETRWNSKLNHTRGARTYLNHSMFSYYFTEVSKSWCLGRALRKVPETPKPAVTGSSWLVRTGKLNLSVSWWSTGRKIIQGQNGTSSNFQYYWWLAATLRRSRNAFFLKRGSFWKFILNI